MFIAVVLLVYPRLQHRGQNLFLLLASYYFYGYWDWRFTSLLFISTAVDFLVGQKLHSSGSQKQRKFLLLVSIMVNLSILGFFKYFNFFADSALSLLTAIGFERHFPMLRVILPIGISFYTFKTLSYTVDLYRSKMIPATSFVDYALFVSFFPQILAGPIERASKLLSQVSNPRRVTREKILTGMNLVLIGYFKKVAIADTLAPIVARVFDAPDFASSGQLWTGIYAYTLQIYGDFSGYTDIARGIARILGFDSMENFNAPYLSRNIGEFWRRWHISLSSWFRDYLYIPLGGNRSGRTRTYANLIITMGLCGLWHGASWNFLIWGLLHGIYLAGYRLLAGDRKSGNPFPRSLSGWIAELIKILLTFHLVAVAWIFFRSSDLSSALIYLKGLLKFQEVSGNAGAVAFAGCLIIFLDVTQTWSGSHFWLTDRQGTRIVRYGVIQLLILSVVVAAIAQAHVVTPFIYFQF